MSCPRLIENIQEYVCLAEVSRMGGCASLSDKALQMLDAFDAAGRDLTLDDLTYHAHDLASLGLSPAQAHRCLQAHAAKFGDLQFAQHEFVAEVQVPTSSQVNAKPKTATERFYQAAANLLQDGVCRHQVAAELAEAFLQTADANPSYSVDSVLATLVELQAIEEPQARCEAIGAYLFVHHSHDGIWKVDFDPDAELCELDLSLSKLQLDNDCQAHGIRFKE